MDAVVTFLALTALVPSILFALGLGFAFVNLREGLQLIRWMRRRSAAVLVWPAPKPPYYGLNLAIAVMLGALLLFKVFFQLDSGPVIFGELMMFIYFGYAVPLSTRIKRGFYADGVWTDGGFISFRHISGLSWKEGERPTLIVISNLRASARRLEVPGPLYGEARALLREKIATYAIMFEGGPGLHLGDRDVRDSV